MNPAGDHRSLAGIRVVDLSRALAGPYATMMLADVGADVLKVEPPAGDDSRGWLPFVETPDGAPEGAATESAYFLSANRGKRSVRLDLKEPAGADRLRALCAEADVLVENYRPGLLARLGLDPATLREDNPRLVTLSITGFGSGGPDGARPGFDQIVQAEAGLMGLTGSADGDRPGRAADRGPAAGMFGAFGVCPRSASARPPAAAGRSRRACWPRSRRSTPSTAPGGSRRAWSPVAQATAIRRSPPTAASGAPTRPWSSPSGPSRCGAASPRRRARPRPARHRHNRDRVGGVDALQAEIDGLLSDRKAEDVLTDLVDAGVPPAGSAPCRGLRLGAGAPPRTGAPPHPQHARRRRRAGGASATTAPRRRR